MKVTTDSACHGAAPDTGIDGLPRCSHENCHAVLDFKHDEPLLVAEGEQTVAHVAVLGFTPQQRLAERAHTVQGGVYTNEGLIVTLEQDEDGRRYVTINEDPEAKGGVGWGGIPPEDECLIEGNLAIGDRVRVFIERGSTVLGMDVWGNTDADNVEGDHWLPVYFKPEAERLQEWAKAVADSRVRRATEYVEGGKAKLDAAYDSLPDVFKRRLDKYRANNPNFRQEFEQYETFCLTEAVTIAEHLRPAYEEHAADLTKLSESLHALDGGKTFATQGEWFTEIAAKPENDRKLYAAQAVVTAFDRLPYEEQVAAGVSDEHSGNTHGMAIRMAMLYLAGRDDLIVGHYGAMAPLVGSDQYGDVPQKAAAS